MKACGIIVEYNPFHNGHRYHANMARKQTGADVVIAVMSGNFLQRGEPAILDKWARAKAALCNGIDLVIELPIEWSVQSADYFARGAIRLLQKIGCDYLCFGTEGDHSFDYQVFGSFVQENQEKIDQTFFQLTDQTMSYPQKMTEVFNRLYPAMNLDFSSPNHMLGLSYAKENAQYDQPMQLVPIARKNAGYHDHELPEQSIASATAIRKALGEKKQIDQYVPIETAKFFHSVSIQTWETYWPLLHYRLLSSEMRELRSIYQMTEGIEVRFLKAAKEATTFTDFIALVKTKRYTWTRLQRLACYTLLNMKTEEVKRQQVPLYLNLLGSTKNGRAFLKEKRMLPVFAKIGKQEAQIAHLLIRSDQIYQMAPGVQEQNFGRRPYIYE